MFEVTQDLRDKVKRLIEQFCTAEDELRNFRNECNRVWWEEDKEQCKLGETQHINWSEGELSMLISRMDGILPEN